MRMLTIGILAFGICSPVAHCGAFRRDLPEAYVPGRSLTVTLEPTGSYWDSSFYVYETVPPGWSFENSSHAMFLSLDLFDPATRTIHWTIDLSALYAQVPPPPLIPLVIPKIRYEVTPPSGQTGEVTFDGYDGAQVFVTKIGDEYFWGPDPDPSDNRTNGDTSMSDRLGVTVRVPADYPTIQAAVDASLFGDTVLVSGRDAPYAEDVHTKQGVDIIGSPASPPPKLNGDDTAIIAAPYCKISGFIIGWSACGIRVEDPTVEISNCVITGMQDAAIEYVGAAVGKVTNCTIVDNEGVGILCYEPSPSVVISNSILFGNGGKDFEKCTARFCLLEDEIEPGSGENNISADPMFVGPAEGDYGLLRGSPCIDAGDNSGIPAEAKDILGKPRILFGGKSESVDIGAYEYWFISAARLPGTPDLQLRWSSGPDRTYSVFLSDDLLTWQVADDSVPSAGATTLWTDPIGRPPPVSLRFYRVTENE